MTEERSMREELNELADRLAQREAELEKLESVMASLEEKQAENLPSVDSGRMPETIIVPPPEPVVVRDPAVVELLKQSAGMVARYDHLRISVENLDRKFDNLARELVRWRGEDMVREEAEGVQGGGEVFNRKFRLAIMAFVFLVVILIWSL